MIYSFRKDEKGFPAQKDLKIELQIISDCALRVSEINPSSRLIAMVMAALANFLTVSFLTNLFSLSDLEAEVSKLVDRKGFEPYTLEEIETCFASIYKIIAHDL